MSGCREQASMTILYLESKDRGLADWPGQSGA